MSENILTVTRKPPTFQAFRWTGENYTEAREALNGLRYSFYRASDDDEAVLEIQVGEDRVRLKPGEWFVRDWGQSTRPLSESRFTLLYERVEE